MHADATEDARCSRKAAEPYSAAVPDTAFRRGDHCTVERHGHQRVARIMAVADGYAMLRYPQAVPFVKPLSCLRKI